MVRVIFHMKGFIYSANKKEWKKVLKSYEMIWEGNMENWIWTKDDEQLVAYFDRDMSVGERGVTLDAYLMWQSKHEMTDFGEAFIDYWEEIEGVEKVDKLPQEEREELPEQELAAFDKKMQSIYDNHKRNKAPEGYLKAVKKDWQEKREILVKELGLDKTDENEESRPDDGFY